VLTVHPERDMQVTVWSTVEVWPGFQFEVIAEDVGNLVAASLSLSDLMISRFLLFAIVKRIHLY